MRLWRLGSQMLTLPVLTLLMLLSVARNSAAFDNSDASCQAQEKLPGEHLIGGAVLLQLKGASESTAAKYDAEDGTPSITMLQKEVQSLDDVIEANAKNLDDIVKESLPAQGRGDSEISGAEKQGLSLLSLDSQEVLAAQNVQGETVSQGLQGMRAWTVDGSQPGSRAGNLAHGVPPEPKAAVEGDRKHAGRAGAHKVTVMEQSSAKVSLKSSRVALSERGYLAIARLRSNQEMIGFVKRVISELSLKIHDPGGLAGVVPFYSGRKTTQSLAALKAELHKTARRRGGWLKKDAHRESFSLAQTQAQTHGEAIQHHSHHHQHHHHHHTSSSEAPQHVSLLQGASAAVHKVPDLMLGFFGGNGRAVFLVLTGVLVLGVFYMDESKRTAGAYENPLDISPHPEIMKDDMVVASTLKVVQGKL